MKEKYSYNDVTLVPKCISEIEHRSECNPLNDLGFLPLFTAPMDSVVGNENCDMWEDYGITAIIPRTIPFGQRVDYAELGGYWIAVGLEEFKKLIGGDYNINGWKILIDVANGHMKIIYDLVKLSKTKFNYTVMVGNIANPFTYTVAADSGVDYIRVGIGGGFGCTTAPNTSIFYPYASLINEVYEIKKWRKDKHTPFIVADGGIRSYGDVIKALALGADYVMCGSIFSRMLEASGTLYGPGVKEIKDTDKIEYLGSGKFLVNDEPTKITKKFYGMASKEGQIAIGGEHKKTSEGLSRWIDVEYTMKSWSDNMKDYMKSAMSYLGIRNIKDFPTAEKIIISQGTRERVNK